MKEVYLITAEQIIGMFLLITVGFLLRRSKALPAQSGKTLSTLETALFLPALVFNNLSGSVNAGNLSNSLRTLLTGLGFLVAVVAVANLLARLFGKTPIKRNFYTYIFAFPNYAYFGYPLIEAVFGREMLANTVIFAIPFTIAIYTYGVYLLTGGGVKKTPKERLKSWFSPVIVAVVLGILVGIFALPVPSVLGKALTMSAACMSPVAMVLIGFVLAGYPLRDLFRSGSAYVVSLIRLLALPLGFGSILFLLGFRGPLLLIPVIITCMPVGMNVVIFEEAQNRDSKVGARIGFVSDLLAALTIPVLFVLVSQVAALP
ncbi:MAG: AEC family transporter [Eubacteriales bacterium]